MQKEIDYNKKSAKKYGWNPSWFGSRDFDSDLVINIKVFQKEHGLFADGMCGPSTHRRIWADRESKLDELEPPPTKFKNTIVHNDNFYDIGWGRVVHWFDPAGLTMVPGTYRSWVGKEERKPQLFVNHWDVCLSSRSCVRVLQQQGISVHFCIDNDGTIYQLMDTQHVAWHAGSSLINDISIGVEISNAFYTKYQDTYISQGFGERPVVDGVMVHGNALETHLGFYLVQLDALTALWEAISRIHGIPLKVPEINGEEVTSKYGPAISGKFSGFVSHYHLTDRKIDCAGLQHIELAKKAISLQGRRNNDGDK